jgi:hypothetical protein
VEHPSVTARVDGVDAHHLSRNGKWRTDVQFMRSDVDGTTGEGVWADVQYTARRGLTHSLSLDYQDDTLDIGDLGFLTRNDMIGGRFSTMMSRSDLDWLRRWSGGLTFGHYVNGAGERISAGAFLYNSFELNSGDRIRAVMNYFAPQWEDLESRGNGAYRVRGRRALDVSYGTNSSKPLSWSVQLSAMDEDIESQMVGLSAGFTYKPMDRFSLDVDLTRRAQDAWLLWQGDANFATYEAATWQPKVAMDLFLSARQQLRFTMQWAGIRAKEQQFYSIPEHGGHLERTPEDPTDDAGFTISRLTAQLRYRWEIAPLSDLWVVYTRGSNLDNRIHDEFDNLFQDALLEPIVDMLVVKLRYRLGG